MSRSLRSPNKLMKTEPVENCQILRNHIQFRKPPCTAKRCRLVYTETVSKSFLCSHSHPSLTIFSGKFQLSLVWRVLEFCGIFLKRGRSPASFLLLQSPNPVLPCQVQSLGEHLPKTSEPGCPSATVEFSWVPQPACTHCNLSLPRPQYPVLIHISVQRCAGS